MVNARVVVLALLVGPGTWSCSPSAGAALSDQVIGDRGKAATVLIISDWSATIHHPGAPDLQLEAVTAAARSGRLGTSPAEQATNLLHAVAEEPFRFLTPPTALRPAAATTRGVGSGFIATPAGHVVTNAHVVARGEDFAAGFWDTGLAAVVDLALDRLVRGVTEALGAPPDAASVAAAREGLSRWFASHSEMHGLTQHLSVVLGRSQPGGRVGEVDSGTIVAIGEAIPGRDVAILKLDLAGTGRPLLSRQGPVGAANLPTLPLGDDQTLAHGDRVFVFGYPADVLEHEILESETLREPTFNSGTLSGRERTRGGWTSLQVNAEFHHGSSGGPVLNSAGQVIGLATFITRNRATGERVPGMNFVLPVSMVRQFLVAAGAAPGVAVIPSGNRR